MLRTFQMPLVCIIKLVIPIRGVSGVIIIIKCAAMGLKISSVHWPEFKLIPARKGVRNEHIFTYLQYVFS